MAVKQVSLRVARARRIPQVQVTSKRCGIMRCTAAQHCTAALRTAPHTELLHRCMHSRAGRVVGDVGLLGIHQGRQPKVCASVFARGRDQGSVL